MHRYSSDFILQWYLLSPSTKNKPADCYVALSHEYAAHASARHPFVPRQAALFTSFPHPPAWMLVPTPGGILLAPTLASAFSPRVLNVSERGRTSRTRWDSSHASSSCKRFGSNPTKGPKAVGFPSGASVSVRANGFRSPSDPGRDDAGLSTSCEEKCPKSVRFPFLS